MGTRPVVACRTAVVNWRAMIKSVGDIEKAGVETKGHHTRTNPVLARTRTGN